MGFGDIIKWGPPGTGGADVPDGKIRGGISAPVLIKFVRRRFECFFPGLCGRDFSDIGGSG